MSVGLCSFVFGARAVVYCHVSEHSKQPAVIDNVMHKIVVRRDQQFYTQFVDTSRAHCEQVLTVWSFEPSMHEAQTTVWTPKYSSIQAVIVIVRAGSLVN
eukprot:TRINITY_DN2378_c0_g1_i1.p1 TRINITY_DN2378_c0_g1~~TRINITY_DN2378_c0_g1_i1.p1  ORF type:complete len:100 (+),score=3.26 TRINITY_DN2378_c0_g1_i1:355-654(+)